MSASYQEVAKANAKALLEELNFTGDEYAQMLAQQSEMITSLQEENEILKEEARVAKLKVKEIQNKHSEVKD